MKKKILSLILISFLIGGGLFVSHQFILDQEGKKKDRPIKAPEKGKKPPLTMKKVVFTADTHFGNIEGGTEQAIRNWRDWMVQYNPDYAFHLGDITESGGCKAYQDFISNYTYIKRKTALEDMWVTSGGGHDGIKDDSGNWNSREGARDQGWIGVRYLYRRLNYPSLYYAVEYGNMVYISLNTIDNQFKGVYTQNKLDWFEETLAYYADTEKNILVGTHKPLYHTGHFTHGWNGGTINKETSNHILSLLKRYRCDIFITGHVHTDSEDYHSEHEEVMGGKVVWGSMTDRMPDETIFVSNPVICWKHGGHHKNANHPEVFYTIWKEGKKSFTLKSKNVRTREDMPITYNNSREGKKSLNISLSYPIQLPEHNKITGWKQAWDISHYSDESPSADWYDEKGFVTEKKRFWIVVDFRFLEKSWVRWFSDPVVETNTDAISINITINITHSPLYRRQVHLNISISNPQQQQVRITDIYFSYFPFFNNYLKKWSVC